MRDSKTYLLRERFIIRTADAGDEEEELVAASNRINLNLRDEKRDIDAHIVVRAKNMYGCVRMAAQICQAFTQGKVHNNYYDKFDWRRAWQNILNEYEHTYNPQNWCAVYADGNVLFSHGHHHAFLDVVESCYAHSNGDYEQSLSEAEKRLEGDGHKVNVEYISMIGLIADLKPEKAKCGLLLRGLEHPSTFNFFAKSKDKSRPVTLHQCLTAAGDFLEGIQLTFDINLREQKIKQAPTTDKDAHYHHIHAAEKRLEKLSSGIQVLEDLYDVDYCPQPLNFQELLTRTIQMPQEIVNAKNTR